MSAGAQVRLLEPADHAAWLPLWQGYLDFYEATIPNAATATCWHRMHDASEPMIGLGAVHNNELIGIVHLVFHRSFWTVEDYCYLQDLFVAPSARGTGAGRALIEAAYATAAAKGAGRVHWLTQESNETARKLYDAIAVRSGFIQYRKLLG